MFEALRTIVQCGTLLVLAFLILLALPQSRLREIVMPFVAWAVAVLSAVYVVSPIDVVPDFVPVAGWADDLVAIAIGVSSALAAINAGKAKQLP